MRSLKPTSAWQLELVCQNPSCQTQTRRKFHSVSAFWNQLALILASPKTRGERLHAAFKSPDIESTCKLRLAWVWHHWASLITITSHSSLLVALTNRYTTQPKGIHQSWDRDLESLKHFYCFIWRVIRHQTRQFTGSHRTPGPEQL